MLTEEKKHELIDYILTKFEKRNMKMSTEEKKTERRINGTKAIVTLIGYATKKPELKVTASGNPSATFSLGFQGKFNDGFAYVTDYGFRPEDTGPANHARYIDKGDKVLIMGNLEPMQVVQNVECSHCKKMHEITFKTFKVMPFPGQVTYLSKKPKVTQQEFDFTEKPIPEHSAEPITEPQPF